MQHLFFLLSGGHPTLPFAEVKAVLEAENFPYIVVEELPQILRVEADERCVSRVSSRCGMTKLCCLEIFTCGADKDEIFEKAAERSYKEFVKPGESFAVRVNRIQRSSPNLDIKSLERGLGGVIYRRLHRPKVNLKNPNKMFMGFFSKEKFVFGLKLSERFLRSFTEKKARKKPFSHPSAMPAKLARCMVNLARPKIGQVVLDPFCGAGSLLIEAGLIGCKTLGIDIKRKMAEGALKNLRYYSVETIGIIVGDARKLPISNISCIVADPPYGRSATTLGSTTREIVNDFLIDASKILSSHGHISIACPRAAEALGAAEKVGFKIREKHFIYIHKGLTREITVLEKI